MNNQAGIITIDFLFAIVIAFGMSAILFAMTFTLTVVEISQYIVFSAARTHAAASLNIEEQKSAGRQKYGSLISSPAFKALYSNGWFEISPKDSLEIRSGYGESFKDDYPGTTQNRPAFTGIRTTLVAKMLDMKLPLIGKTSDDEGGFSTKIVSILIREPTQTECQKHIADRFSKINQLDTRFSSYSNGTYTPVEDNGC